MSKLHENEHIWVSEPNYGLTGFMTTICKNCGSKKHMPDLEQWEQRNKILKVSFNKILKVNFIIPDTFYVGSDTRNHTNYAPDCNVEKTKSILSK